MQISGFLLYAAPSSLCTALVFSPLVNPHIWSAFPPALVWILLPHAVVLESPRQKAIVNMDFTSSVLLLSSFPSVADYLKTIVLYILSSFTVIFWWEGKSDIPSSVMLTPRVTLVVTLLIYVIVEGPEAQRS